MVVPAAAPPPSEAADPLASRIGRRAYLGASAALAALSLVLGLVRLTWNDVWYDEVASLHFARHGGLDFFRFIVREDNHGPVYYGFLHLWLLAFGDSAAVARLSSVLLAAATVPVVVALGTRLWGPRAGLIAGLLLATSRLHIYYAQEIRFYSFIALCASVQVLAWLALAEKPKAADETRSRWWFPACVASGVAMLLTFYFSILVFAAELVALALLRRHLRVWRALAALAVTALGFVPWLPFFWWQIHHSTGSVGWIWQRPTWQFLHELVMALSAGPLAGALGWLLAAPLLATFALGVAASLRRRSPGGIVVVAWFVLPLVALLLISLKQPLYEPRYLVMSVPALFLLAAAGVAQVRARWPRTILAAAVLAGLLIGDGRYYTHFKHKDRWRDAVAFVREHATRDETLVMVPMHEVVTLHYYFRDFGRLGAANFPFQVSRYFRRGSRLWLFEHSDQYHVDPTQLGPDTLLLERHAFGSLEVSTLLLRR
jgi:mannosyltransferase